MDLKQLRIGYVPLSHNLDKPGDRRRFVYYAKSHNLPFEIATPDEKYDVVVVSQSADLSIWSEYDKGKIVYDFIDSYLAVPRSSVKGRLRGLAKYLSGQSRHPRLNHWKALESMCARADAVVCTTREQAGDISSFCSNVHLILDVHSSVARTFKTDYRAGEVFNLVWEGIADNVYAFDRLRCVFTRLQTRHKIALHLITDLEFRRYLGLYGKTSTADMARGLCERVYLYEWNEQMCSNIICASDLAVIPIDLADPLVRGKPENKLVLFWRMGMPAVTSATPAYERAMTKAGLSMTCRNEDEWLATLEKYIGDETARRAAGMAGRCLAESNYGEEIILRQWDKLFDSLFLSPLLASCPAVP